MCKILKGRKSPIRRLLVLGNIPYDEESKGIFWFPVLYYHPLMDSVVCEYRTFIWGDDDVHALFVFNWSVVSNCAEERYRLRTVWEKTYGEQALDPIPDTVFEPKGFKTNPEEDLWQPPYRISFASPKLESAFSAARSKRF